MTKKPPIISTNDRPLRDRTTVNFLQRIQERVLGVFVRYPWLGWAVWLIFCITTLLRTHPRRFGSTFQAYLTAAHNFWNGQPIYDLSQLGEYLYWPVSLLVLGPLPNFPPVVAAAIATAVAAIVLSLASVALMRALLPERPAAETLNLAGVLLMINIPAAWFNFKYVQAQIGMTAFMMLAAAAISRRHWLMASFWLFLSVVTKPLSLVMLLLCGATQPRMRLALGLALIAALLLPFAFADANYVAGQYRTWIVKLQQLVSVAPGEWLYQADFATMLNTVGIDLPAGVADRPAAPPPAPRGRPAVVRRVARKPNPLLSPRPPFLAARPHPLGRARHKPPSFLVPPPPPPALRSRLLAPRARGARGWGLVGGLAAGGLPGPPAAPAPPRRSWPSPPSAGPAG